MKKSRIDRQQDFLLWLLRPLVYLWMWMDAGRKVIAGPEIDFHRKEPFVMLANHTFLFDVVHVPLSFRNVPFIIGSQTLFTRQPTKFLVSQMAHVIPKSKGKSDISTIIQIFNAIKKGYPILIFPEGDTTFYGETGYIEASTMKLIKKLGLDLIICNVKGGYLSKPRWATNLRKNRKIRLDYTLLLTKEEVKQVSVEKISELANRALYNNDYDYQRQVMIPHPGKHLAEGLEDVVYVCPHCEGINTLRTSGNKIICDKCKHEGYIDDFGFIHGFKFDNLIDWDNFQKQFSGKLRQSTIETTGVMHYLHMETDAQIPIGKIGIKYQDNNLFISNSHTETIPIDQTSNATVTLRRDLGFIYDNRHFIIRLDHFSAQFLRILQDKY